MSASIDNRHSIQWSVSGNFSNFKSRYLYLAGAEDVRSLDGSRTTRNFIGCLKEVSFTF